MRAQTPLVLVSHIGYLCNAQKRVATDCLEAGEFIVEDLSAIRNQNLGEDENWQEVFRGNLTPVQSPMGQYLTGDFSALTTPGMYRVVLPACQQASVQFAISDSAFSVFPRLFLDFMHHWRSGDFSDALRGPVNTDDGIRSDNGHYQDVSGGWCDAGDLRKWMTTTPLPVLGFLAVNRLSPLSDNYFANEVYENDLISESVWMVQFILKMQCRESGMFFEAVGSGGNMRDNGQGWWYENHSGCLADNSDNRLTDNITASGDERTIRVAYNPVVQYINIIVLLRTAAQTGEANPDLAAKCRNSALKAWRFTLGKKDDDPMHNLTVVRAWRLMAVIEIHQLAEIQSDVLTQSLEQLLENWNDDLAFWQQSADDSEPYRGILHSAQPLIALARFVETYPLHVRAEAIHEMFTQCFDRYIVPLCATNPFGIVPYGLFNKLPSETDVFHDWNNNMKFRYFLPVNTPQRINHGLASHWTSWAHALALWAKLLNDNRVEQFSWAQLHWLIGFNPLNISMITGAGYNQPQPYSRFFGPCNGGFMNGPAGDANDHIEADMQQRYRWNSTEYWVVPLANMLLALTALLPGDKAANKLGGCKKTN